MLTSDKVLVCRIIEITKESFKVRFFDGSEKVCYFEDLPYLETGKNLKVGDIIKVYLVGNKIVPLLSRPRNNYPSSLGFDSRRNKKIYLMESFDYASLMKKLDEQIDAELEFQKGEIK